MADNGFTIRGSSSPWGLSKYTTLFGKERANEPWKKNMSTRKMSTICMDSV